MKHTNVAWLLQQPHYQLLLFLEAMESARISAPTLAIGVHLTLTLNQAKPILPREMVPSLVDEAGYFGINRF